MKYYDITPEIHSGLAVFPGDQKFERKVSLDFQAGDHLALSSIQTTLHLGAHADSSSHYHKSGTGIETRSLNCYLGEAQVIQVANRPGQRIQPQDLQGQEILAPRVLFATGSFPNPDRWQADFMSLSPELIEFLHLKKCLLVGIDTPSVDPETSKGLESHQALYRTQMAVLEGLLLRQVPPGLYTLVALPLPIRGGDASPVRAILLEPGLVTTPLNKA